MLRYFMPTQYYYIDINIETLQVITWGISETANHTGETENPTIHRVFFASPGQYNKFVAKVKEFQENKGNET